MKKSILALLIATSFMTSASDDILNKLVNGDEINFNSTSYITNNNLSEINFSDLTYNTYFDRYYGNNLQNSYMNLDFNNITQSLSSIRGIDLFQNDIINTHAYLNVENVTNQDITGVNVLPSWDYKGETINVDSVLSINNSPNINDSIYIAIDLLSYIESNLNGMVYVNNSTISKSHYMTNIYGVKAAEMQSGIIDGEVIVENSSISGTYTGAYLNTYSTAARMMNVQNKNVNSLTVNGNVYVSNVSLNNDTILFGASVISEVQNTIITSSGNVSIFNQFSNDNEWELKIYGGYLFDVMNLVHQTGIFENNNLNIGSNPFHAESVSGFKNYNFYINDYNYHVVNSNESILTVDTELAVGEFNPIIDRNGDSVTRTSKVEIKGISGEYNPIAGDTIGLIKVEGQIDRKIPSEDLAQIISDGSIANFFGETVENKVKVGLVSEATIDYIFDDENKMVTAVIKDIKAMDNDDGSGKKETFDFNVKPLTEGRLAVLMDATRNIDTVNDLLGKDEEIGTFTPMVKISGGKNKYGSNSNNVDSNDYRFTVGTRYQFIENFYAGLTASYGISNYDTKNSFRFGNVNGSGNAKAYDITAFGKYTYNDFYAKVAVSLGRTSNKYRSNDIITGGGTNAKYTSKANYVSALAGVGYEYRIDEDYSFDSSLTYFYTKLNSDSITIDGDKVKFKNATSSRIQLKEQFNYKAMYMAVAYENEFDSKSVATLKGKNTNTDAKGSTGILELGLKGNPFTEVKALEFNMNAKGYIGRREGISASIYAQYNF